MIYNKLGENAVSITCQNVEGWHTTLMKNIFLHSFRDLKSKEVRVFINLAYYINICLSQAFGSLLPKGSKEVSYFLTDTHNYILWYLISTQQIFKY